MIDKNIRSYIILALIVGLLINIFSYYNIRKNIDVKINDLKEKRMLIASLENNKDFFSISQTNKIIRSKKFYKYVSKNKSKQKLNITLRAPYDIANRFIKELGNSKAILGNISITELPNNSLKISFKVDL
jgi:cell division protein YceG involved in septum cleavage